jgi:hypothetical protein
MKPLRARAPLAFVAGALILLGLTWVLTDALGESALGIAQPGFMAPRAAAVDVQRVLVPPSAPEDARKAMADTPAEREPAAKPVPDHAGSLPRRVRVQGRLFCLITRVPVHEVTFVNVDFPRIQDWDFTDEDGRYEVEVPPGRYDVVSNENDVETRLARVIVPADSAELALDLEAR